jgi:hypothetical protein
MYNGTRTVDLIPLTVAEFLGSIIANGITIARIIITTTTKMTEKNVNRFLFVPRIRPADSGSFILVAVSYVAGGCKLNKWLVWDGERWLWHLISNNEHKFSNTVASKVKAERGQATWKPGASSLVL